MSDPALLVSLASAGTLALGLTASVALRGWQEWLDLRRLEIARRGGRTGGNGRPDIADLRARVRRLESIASGMEA